mgnify:CR=1 FL=1
MIRAAVFADIPRLVSMGERFIAETSYCGKLASNAQTLAALMHRLISHEDGTVMVSLEEGSVTGMIGAFVYEHPMSGERIAGEAFWWVEPEKRGCGVRLMKAVEAWANDRNAVRLTMIAPTDKVARLYRACGYDKLEEHYQKDI